MSIPAIADANSLEYSLHLPVGEELTVRDGAGAPLRLRIVAALKDSILQGALIVSEDQLPADVPWTGGLPVLPRRRPGGRGLRRSPPRSPTVWPTRGLRVESAGERLAGFHRVENTYLSTFQSLGALGLVLGTIGLLAVLLRNVLERRSELALLRAVGYRERTLAAMVVGEHVLLLAVRPRRAGPSRRSWRSRPRSPPGAESCR